MSMKQSNGTKRTAAVEKLKRDGATADQIKSFLRGWDQLNRLAEQQGNENGCVDIRTRQTSNLDRRQRQATRNQHGTGEEIF